MSLLSASCVTAKSSPSVGTIPCAHGTQLVETTSRFSQVTRVLSMPSPSSPTAESSPALQTAHLEHRDRRLPEASLGSVTRVGSLLSPNSPMVEASPALGTELCASGTQTMETASRFSRFSRIMSLLSSSSLREGRIVSGSKDRTVRIWKAVSGDCEQILSAHEGSVYLCTLYYPTPPPPTAESSPAHMKRSYRRLRADSLLSRGSSPGMLSGTFCVCGIRNNELEILCS
jgi:hypothetical protein